MKTPLPLLACSLALLSLASPLRGQEGAIPEAVADALVSFYNDPATVRYTGRHTIAAGDTVRADVAAMGGPLIVGGLIEGSVVMLNGDVRLLPGASVAGGVTVVGGTVEGVEGAIVGDEVVVFEEGMPVRRDGLRLVRGEGLLARAGVGRSDFLIATGTSYNRVEGMPITFGPRIRTGGSNPLRADALAIYRTEAGLTLDPDEMGYYARVEQYVGGFQALRVGVTAHSLVDPIEDWQLSDLENGLTTFLFHEDFRDHYERRGVSLYSFWRPRGSPLELGLEALSERHRSLAAGTPWSLTDNAEPWRPQPHVGEGRLTTLRALATFDSRSSASDPATGWYLRGRVERALRSDLVQPGGFVDPESPLFSTVGALEPMELGLFTTGMIDVRRYNRVDPSSRLNFRFIAAGALDGGNLPPQRQHVLGGEGSLPGYPLFEHDCGARGVRVHDGDATAPFYPYYGCDAFALFQAEFRGKLSLRFLWESVPWSEEARDDEDWGFVMDLKPDWTFFVDAGQGWSREGRPRESLAADVGMGILVNRFGLFFAAPLSGGEGVNLFARIGPRF